MFRSFHLIIGFSNKIFLKLGNWLSSIMIFECIWSWVLNSYWKVFMKSSMSPDDRLSSCWFQKNDVHGSSWHLPGCSSLLWSSEQTLARSRQVTLDNSCNSSLGPFSSSISELQPTFKCIMLCKQIFSHFLLVHIKARSYDSRAARDLVVWVVTLQYIQSTTCRPLELECTCWS